MYQALYRKYRPLVFSDVVGQAHITDTLRAQVSAGRLSHAYLFTGTRGTGKTTCAKILARASNCLAPVGGNPCNQCVPCLGALDGSLLDVMEIDAASNSGVDNIRALRDEAAYTPVSARRRVYIIDEVHMLSPSAFNALLKTLEEPPAYVLFILATTEIHKVPATILSRCQRFAFKRLGESDIASRLCHVAQKEGIPLTGGAASLLARLSDGALRDALSLLDQCAAAMTPQQAADQAGAVAGSLDTAEVYQALGMAGDDVMSRWADFIACRDARQTLELFREQVGDGRDIASLLSELSQTIRSALLDVIQRGETSKSGDAGGLRELPSHRLLAMLTAVQDGLSRLSRAVQPRIEAELCLIRLCHAEGDVEARVKRLEDAISGRPQTDKMPEPPVKKAPPPKPEPPVSRAPERKPEPKNEPPQVSPAPVPQEAESKPAPVPKEQTPAAGNPQTAPEVSGGAVDWKALRTVVASELPHSVGSFLLLDDVTLRQSDGLWQVVAPNELAYSRLSGHNVLNALTAAAKKAAGRDISVRVIRQDPHEKQSNPQLQMLLDQFDE